MLEGGSLGTHRWGLCCLSLDEDGRVTMQTWLLVWLSQKGQWTTCGDGPVTVTLGVNVPVWSNIGHCFFRGIL